MSRPELQRLTLRYTMDIIDMFGPDHDIPAADMSLEIDFAPTQLHTALIVGAPPGMTNGDGPSLNARRD